MSAKIIDITSRLKKKEIKFIDILKKDPAFEVRLEKVRQAVERVNKLFDDLKKDAYKNDKPKPLP